jgi:hypothetical protein
MKKLTALLMGLALLGGAATAKADSITLSSGQMDRVTAGHLTGFWNGQRHSGWYWRWYNNSWHQVFGFHVWPYYYGQTGFQFGFKRTPTAPNRPPPTP